MFLSPQHSSWEVSLVLYPSTAEDSVSQFVRLTLKLTLDQQVSGHNYNVALPLHPLHLKRRHLLICAHYHWVSQWHSTASDYKWTRSDANYKQCPFAGFLNHSVCSKA